MKSRILFVDDEPNFLQGIRLMLRGQRDVWDITFAQSADEAYEKSQDNDFHAIVSDVTMPVKSGLDLLQMLRESDKTKNTPVVILTGNAEADLKRRALDLGATDLLNKPTNSEDLIARLQSVLRLRAYQDELKTYNETLECRVQERTEDLAYSQRDIIWRLAKAGEFRDEETGDHVIRVAGNCRVLAEALSLDPETVDSIFLTSPLHDVGKIGIPDGILLKKGKLDVDERAIMERHCEIGASILLEEPKGMRLFHQMPTDISIPHRHPSHDSLRDMAVSIVISHHEKWDGTGYPNALKGEDIPIAGRIVAISDVYDALRSERPYKKEFTVEESVNIISESVGTHFDPTVLDHFQECIGKFEDIRKQFSL